MSSTAKWSIGQIVIHIKQGYRGVIYDVDACFSESDIWYEKMALSKPPKANPWYRVLVDREATTTYVAERHLRLAEDQSRIDHPLLSHYLLWNNIEQCYKKIEPYS